MAGIDYGLIGRFKQVEPGGLSQAFRGGVDLRGQMTQNQRQGQALIADQFANQQAPILADRATQMFGQDMTTRQANEKSLLAQAQAKQQEAEIKKREDSQKFYTESGEKIGAVMAAVKRNEQIPFAFDYLDKMAQSNVIDPKAWNNIKQTIGQNVPDVGMVNYIGQTTIKAIDQISKENERLRAEQQALREQGVQQRFEVAEAGKERRLLSSIGAQNQRAESGANTVVETDQGIVLVNKRTGQVTPVQGEQGAPVIKSATPKNLSREAAMGVSIGRALDDNLTELKQKMTSGDFKQNVIEAKTPGSDLNRVISDAVDLLGKKRSGAALNASEEKLYQNLITNKYDVVFNNKQAFLNQIERLQKENKYFLEALTGPSKKQTNTTQNPYGLTAKEQEEFDRLGGSKK